MNRFFKKAVIFVLPLLVCYACKVEMDNSFFENAEDQRTIEKVKAWYAAHQPEEININSPDGTSRAEMKAVWSHAFVTRNENYEVVETDLMSKVWISYIDSACMAKYNETNDPKYKLCYTRLVFRTNLETKDTVGFLMTFVPNLEWLEKSNFKPFIGITYLNRSKPFGGTIFYHNLDGSFSNGWKYENGKIIASIKSMNINPNQ